MRKDEDAMRRTVKKRRGRLVVLEERRQGGRRGYLVCLFLGGGMQYLICLEDEGEWAMTLAGEDRSLAESMYERAWCGSLSPMHLEDFCRDERREAEIF